MSTDDAADTTNPPRYTIQAHPESIAALNAASNEVRLAREALQSKRDKLLDAVKLFLSPFQGGKQFLSPDDLGGLAAATADDLATS